jgi:hypothetical protein
MSSPIIKNTKLIPSNIRTTVKKMSLPINPAISISKNDEARTIVGIPITHHGLPDIPIFFI